MNPSYRHGYTLLEVLVYAGILVVLLNLAGGLLLNCTRLSQLGTAMADRQQEVRDVERAFLRTVRESGGAVEGVGPFRTGGGTLVLDLHEGRHAVLGALNPADRFARLVVTGRDDALEVEEAMVYPLPVVSVAFTAEPGRPVTLDLGIPSPRRRGPDPDRLRFVATPRNVTQEAQP